MNRILCSTGAVIGRPNGRNIYLLEECVPKLNCDGFEFMMYSTWYGKADEVKKAALRTGASFPVFHVEKQVGNCISRNGEGDTEKAIELFYINCRIAKELGSKLLVLHLWSGLDSGNSVDCWGSCTIRAPPAGEVFGLVIDSVLLTQIQEFQLHL